MDAQKSFAEVRQSLIHDEQLYDAFAASVKSALDECDFNMIYQLRGKIARFIADRIVGKKEA